MLAFILPEEAKRSAYKTLLFPWCNYFWLKKKKKLVNENKNSTPGSIPEQALPHPCHFSEEGFIHPHELPRVTEIY